MKDLDIKSFEVGDTVTIRHDLLPGVMYDGTGVNEEMISLGGKSATITSVDLDEGYFSINLGERSYEWTPEMTGLPIAKLNEMTPKRLERCNNIAKRITSLKSIARELTHTESKVSITIGQYTGLAYSLSANHFESARIHITELVHKDISELEEEFKTM